MSEFKRRIDKIEDKMLPKREEIVFKMSRQGFSSLFSKIQQDELRKQYSLKETDDCVYWTMLKQ